MRELSCLRWTGSCPAGDRLSSAMTKFRLSIVMTALDGLRSLFGEQGHQTNSDHVCPLRPHPAGQRRHSDV